MHKEETQNTEVFARSLGKDFKIFFIPLGFTCCLLSISHWVWKLMAYICDKVVIGKYFGLYEDYTYTLVMYSFAQVLMSWHI